MIYYKGNELTGGAFSIYLINEYLDKYFENPEHVKSKYNPDDIARLIGERDISFFSLYYLRDIFVVQDSNSARNLSPAHYEMWETLNRTFVEDTIDKLNMVEPRGMAKTTVCDLTLAVWLHCYGKSKFTLMGAKTSDDATQFLDSIKKIFLENEMIKEEFGCLIDGRNYKVNSNEIEFTNNTYIRSVGSASSVRGADWKGTRPTVVICDDYQSEVDILTDEARDKKYNRWTKEVEKVGDTAVYRNNVKIKSATKIISIGTVLHKDCLISRLSRNKDYFTVLKRAIILSDNQTVEDIFESDLWLKCKRLYFDDSDQDAKFTARVFYENNMSEMKYPTLWEDKWDFFYDIAIPYWENRISFMSEMMNDATSIGDKWFKSVRTMSLTEMLTREFTKTIIVADPASTVSKRSDSTAIIVGSVSDNDFEYIRDMTLEKLHYDEYCKLVVDKLVEFEDITHIVIEKNTYSGADVTKIKELILERDELKHRNFEFINEMQRKNKDNKISTIIDHVNNGQIIFADNNKKFTDEILDFRGQLYSLHDDAPDVVSEFSIRVKNINVIHKVNVLDRRALGV